MTNAPELPWELFLPALEEWVRRTAAVVRGATDVEPPPFDAVPLGPLPAEHAVRLQALVQEMQRVQQAGAQRRGELTRARAYTQH